MLEILKIIILTCQVSTGTVVPSAVDRHQKACQKDLINCVRPSVESKMSDDMLLLRCLRERK